MAAKFSMVNPGGTFDAGDHMEASRRMEQAMEHLKVKSENEKKKKELEEKIEIMHQFDVEKKAFIQQKLKDSKYDDPTQQQAQENEIDEGDENNSDDDFLLEDDPELQRLREMRMKQLKKAYEEKQAHIAKGHGQYREIAQDEFLPEVTSSKYVAVHFYHRDFERCKIIDKHLRLIAPHHVECKFLKVNAETAPFFVEKLCLKILPTIMCFQDGVACDERIVGFNRLSDAMPKGKEDEFKTGVLARVLADIGVIQCSDHFDGEEDDDDNNDNKSIPSTGSVYGSRQRLLDDE